MQFLGFEERSAPAVQVLNALPANEVQKDRAA
jgi:hypothetical protein